MKLRRAGVTIGLASTLLLGACATPDVPGTPVAGRALGAERASAPPSGTGAAPGGRCAYQPAPAGNAPNLVDVGTPPATARTTGSATMRITTNLGPLTIKLYPAAAPCAVASFAYLAGKRFFDNTVCHRLTSEGIFVLQCGDPSGTGTGGPTYRYAEENVTQPHRRGVVAVANTGEPGSSGSQFFIDYKDFELPAQYTVFGEVTSGMEVVDKVAAAGDDGSSPGGGGKPKLETKLQQVTVTYG